jgi:hypothetical protein
VREFVEEALDVEGAAVGEFVLEELPCELVRIEPRFRRGLES